MNFENFTVFSNLPKKGKIQKKNNLKKKENLSFGNLNSKQTHELIEKIVSWYKIKFSGSNLLCGNNKDTIRGDIDFDTNFYTMTFDKLANRLSYEEINSFRCHYMDVSNNDDFRKIKKKLNYGSSCVIIELFTNKKNLFINQYDEICFIVADKNTGKILDVCGDLLLPFKLRNNFTNYDLNQVLNLLEKSNDEINFSSLKKCVKKHNNDILLRMKVIDKICEKLLFEDNPDFDVGYYIAMIFLDELNLFYDFNFNYSILDLVIDKYYKKVKKQRNNSSKKRVKSTTIDPKIKLI